MSWLLFSGLTDEVTLPQIYIPACTWKGQITQLLTYQLVRDFNHEHEQLWGAVKVFCSQLCWNLNVKPLSSLGNRVGQLVKLEWWRVGCHHFWIQIVVQCPPFLWDVVCISQVNTPSDESSQVCNGMYEGIDLASNLSGQKVCKEDLMLANGPE